MDHGRFHFMTFSVPLPASRPRRSFRRIARAALGLVAVALLLHGGRAQAASGPTLTINAAVAQRFPISPYIYGVNSGTNTDLANGDSALFSSVRPTVLRWGGNNATRYNWQVNASNHPDYYFHNYGEAQSPDSFITQAKNSGLKAMIQIPMIPWIAKDGSSCSFRISIYGPQQDHEQFDTDCGNGVQPGGDLYNGPYITGNNPADANTANTSATAQAWVTHLINTFGTAANGGVLFYDLDNEPNIWSGTHRDVHPSPVGYDELRNRAYDYAPKIKALDPNAQTLGPSDDGWTRYFFSGIDTASGNWGNPPDRNAHGGVPMAEWYLQQMKAYEVAHGVRILDYFDEHYYTSACNGSGCVTLSTAGDASLQALRLRSTRSLWDATYIDESWIGGVDQDIRQVNLIPRMRGWVNTNYPGTKTAITEYNFGGLEALNGAITQSDVLGIFGREKLDLATLFGNEQSNASNFHAQPVGFAFRMYTNYDGNGSKFGETGVSATVGAGSCPDIGDSIPCLSVYGALRGTNTLTVMVINKSPATSYTSPVSISGVTPSGSAQVWRYSGANLNAIVQQANQATTATGFTATFPPSSITLFVIPIGGAVVRPDTIGAYKDGRFYLRNSNTTGSADISTLFGGDASDAPVVGDWDGDGIDTIGIYRRSTGVFFLSNSNTAPTVAYTFVFGNPNDTPFAGKWSPGATHDGVGVYRNSNGILYQADNLVTGYSNYYAVFGNPGDIGFAGDWNNDGYSSIGIYRSSNTRWYMTNNSQPSGITYSDIDFPLAIGSSIPVIGDWDGDGIATIGYVSSSGVFTLHSANAAAGSDTIATFGPAGARPIAGKWAAGAAPAQPIASNGPTNILVPAPAYATEPPHRFD
jgi:hypothetical protein